ncbi:MAG TPA: DUF6036 family nucleotidyltransferase [Blastocatellia bacterium]|nr:DUF6036 family nucleotidyltransferase [Blastocatellia bacterium]
MQKPYLLDLIRRVQELTGIALPIIVGSQSLFAITDDVPPIVRQSVEADFLIGQEGHEPRQRINFELGVTSNFYDLHGYFADALGLATVVLVPGWEERLQPLADETGTVVARCLELHDVAVSKLMAGREKDFPFIQALLARQLISLPTLVERAALIQETASAGALLPRLKMLYDHLRNQYGGIELKPLTDLIHELAAHP